MVLPVHADGPDDFPDEGVNSLASIGERAAARVIDFLLVAVVLVPFTIPFVERTGKGDDMVVDIPLWVGFASIVITILYEVVMLVLRGQTVGKMVMGLRVVRADVDQNPGGGQAAIRTLLPNGAAPLPIIGLFAYIGIYLTAALNPVRQGWHDRAAGTYVVRTGGGVFKKR